MTSASKKTNDSSFYYWLYKKTQNEIEVAANVRQDMSENEKIQEKMKIDPETYYWNRWMITGLSRKFSGESGETKSNDHLKQLQHSIDETIPSWVKKPTQLDSIEPLTEEEKNKLIATFQNESNSVDPELLDDSYAFNFDMSIWKEEFSMNTAFFYGFIFPEEANFKGAEFGKKALFVRSKFFGKALFDGTEFCKDAFFSAARFSEATSFLGVKFATDNITKLDINSNLKDGLEYEARVKVKDDSKYEARFIETTFLKKTSFYNAEFHGGALFFGALFYGDINRFLGATFSKSPFFYGTIFKSACNLSNTTLDTLPNLMGCEFRGGLDITGMEFRDRKGWKKLYIEVKDKSVSNKVSLINKTEIKKSSDLYYYLKERKKDEITKLTDKTNFKAARHSLQLLRDTAKKNDDTQNELKYLQWEFDVARNDPNEHFVFKILLCIYSRISRYGTGILIPLLWFIFQLFIFWGIYSYLASESSMPSPTNVTSTTTEEVLSPNIAEKQDEENSKNDVPTSTQKIRTEQSNLNINALRYAAINSIVFVPVVNKDYYSNLLEDTSGIKKGKVSEPNQRYFMYWSYFQKLVSLILLFLFTLGIRNRLRLR